MKRLTFLLIIVVILAYPGNAYASSFRDTEGHWAESSIERWAGYGILSGKADGVFDPDSPMLRAEFAVMLDKILGYNEKTYNTFSDVPDDAWYADAVLKLNAAGVMQGSNGKALPLESISREEVAMMLCRALKIDTSGSSELSFEDAANVSVWARPAVSALTSKGMINGIGGGRFSPDTEINRASVAKMLDNIVTEYVTEDKEITGGVGGVVVVADGSNVTFNNAVVSEPVIVSPGSGNSEVRLIGSGSIESMIICGMNGTFTAEEDVSVRNIVIEAANSTSYISGRTDTILVSGKSAAITLGNKGEVNSISIKNTADNAKITTDEGSTLESITTSANNVSVSGSGTIRKVTVFGKGRTEVSTIGTEVTNESSGVTLAGGKDVSEGSTVIITEVPLNDMENNLKPGSGSSSDGSSSSGSSDGGNSSSGSSSNGNNSSGSSDGGNSSSGSSSNGNNSSGNSGSGSSSSESSSNGSSSSENSGNESNSSGNSGSESSSSGNSGSGDNSSGNSGGGSSGSEDSDGGSGDSSGQGGNGGDVGNL